MVCKPLLTAKAIKQMSNLVIILGDQLNMSISSLQGFNKQSDRILMMEVHDETTYVAHHPKKIALILSAMRHFAEELTAKKFKVDYIHLDSKSSKNSFTETLAHYLKTHKANKIIVTEAGEYRVQEMIHSWQKKFGIEIDIRSDDRFLCSHQEFVEWAEGRKELRMEFFYREMRKKYGILIDGNKPVGGKWNYDSDNRQRIPDTVQLISPKAAKPDQITQQVCELVSKRFDKHFGDVEPFQFAVTRKHALACLKHFIEKQLPLFGDYQDAMLYGQDFLFHSILSPYINCGLLLPKEVIEKAQTAYHEGKAPLNAVEGFIRQILGWREFIRGVYWLHAPDYATRNYLHATHDLPDFYWTAATKMRCMQHCINSTKQTAYSHHIQRLMITGNFAMLYGANPQQVHEWYLSVYADAFEWVEMPNTLGMALFADGGVFASKPYAASGNYINKMSDFCSQCHYNVREKTSEDACPFNALYWDFLDRNKKLLQKNMRLKFAYKNLERKTAAESKAIKTRAKYIHEHISEI